MISAAEASFLEVGGWGLEVGAADTVSLPTDTDSIFGLLVHAQKATKITIAMAKWFFI
jgi:hypothetical protein